MTSLDAREIALAFTALICMAALSFLVGFSLGYYVGINAA